MSNLSGGVAVVTQAGGNGIAVACDHANDRQIQELSARVEGEQGHLDLLVKKPSRRRTTMKVDTLTATRLRAPPNGMEEFDLLHHQDAAVWTGQFFVGSATGGTIYFKIVKKHLDPDVNRGDLTPLWDQTFRCILSRSVRHAHETGANCFPIMVAAWCMGGVH